MKKKFSLIILKMLVITCQAETDMKEIFPVR